MAEPTPGTGVPVSYAITGSASNKFVGGLGHTTDDTGLIYMRARYCDPALGRFISEDPAKDGVTWYAYCGSNPINALDPSGNSLLVGELIGDAIRGAGDLKDYVMSFNLKSRIEQKIFNICINWASKYGMFYAESAGGATAEGAAFDIIGTGTGYRILLHLAGHAGEAPHLQVMREGTKQAVEKIFLSEL